MHWNEKEVKGWIGQLVCVRDWETRPFAATLSRGFPMARCFGFVDGYFQRSETSIRGAQPRCD
jgi:hypothetical protein